MDSCDILGHPQIMFRSIRSLVLGIFCTALLIDAISVYVFHDVDQDQVGHWNTAFAGLCTESILFALIIGSSVWLLTLLGRRLIHLRDYSPRGALGFLLGVGVTIIQYPLEFVARLLLPKLAQSFLSLYIVGAVGLCTVVLLRDGFRQLQKAAEPRPPSV